MKNDLTLTTTTNTPSRRGGGILRVCASTLLGLILAAALALVGPPGVAEAAGAGDVSLASHVPNNPTTTANNLSGGPVTSGNGGYVVFGSYATNLVPGQSDTNNAWDLFLLERATGKVTLVSHTAASPTTTGSHGSNSPSISADGAYVAFHSDAHNLATGQNDSNSLPDVFLFERATGDVTLVSHSAPSAVFTGNGRSESPKISADGAFVAFQSRATNLVTGQSDVQGSSDVFLFERATNAVTLVSHVSTSPTATSAGGDSFAPSISANGGYVAFESRAPDLASGQNDNPDTKDVFRFNRSTGVVTLLSHTSASLAQAAGDSYDPSISADGSIVAFESLADNLVSGQVNDNHSQDVFVWVPIWGVRLVSHWSASNTTTANSHSGSPRISADGAFVTFTSSATNLVAGQLDSESSQDGFLYEVNTGDVRLVSHRPNSPVTAAGDAWDLSIDDDGSFVAFNSHSEYLVAAQDEGVVKDDSDVFLFKRATGAVTLVSHTPGSPSTTGGDYSTEPSISADGGIVAFESRATNLVAGQTDANNGHDVFLYQRLADPPPPEITIGDVKVPEGNSGLRTAYFPVTLSKPAPGPVSVKYTTANGTATEPADYTLKSGTVSFATGAVSAQVPVEVKANAADEASATFKVLLSAPVGATVADGTGVGTIVDDDPSSGLRLAVGDVTIDEGDATNRTARLTVSLSKAASSTVTVAYATADGSATAADGDYVAKSGTVTFSAGQTSRPIDVVVNADTAPEAAQTFSVKLSNPTGGATIADGAGVVTIRAED